LLVIHPFVPPGHGSQAHEYDMPLSCGGEKKLLTSKIRYVSIQSMHAQYTSLTNTTHGVACGLSAQSLIMESRGPDFLIPVYLLALLIPGRGAGIG
jgi:hypothetical protein